MRNFDLSILELLLCCIEVKQNKKKFKVESEKGRAPFR